jgi:thiol-disulfide isomerase/thioredoxin
MKLQSYDIRLRTALPILFTLFGVIWIWHSRIPEDQQFNSVIRAPQEGFQSPKINLPVLDGADWKTEDYEGHPLVINFWASWCPPCKAEMPDFQQASYEYSETDLIVIAINATNQDSIDNVRNFLEREDLNLLVLLDTNGNTSRAFQVHSLPTTYFIHRDGTISRTIIGGPIPLALLRTEIGKIIQE